MRSSSWVLVALVVIAALTAHAGADVTVRSITEIPKDSITVATDTTTEKIVYKEVVSTSPLEEKTPDPQLWLFDVKTQVVKLISCTKSGVAGNDWSDSASVSDNGKAVFHSWAGNLAPVPSCANVFLKNIGTGDVMVVKDHALAPAISADGRYVVYEHNADPEKGLPAIYRYEVSSGMELFIDYTSVGNTKGGWYFPNPQISADGLTITYHTTKTGKPEVWQWIEGKKPVKIRDGVL